MAETNSPWGRVTDGGTVEVRLGDQWHSVGAYPDVSPEEALAHYERKFSDLLAQVDLVEQRHKANAPAKDLKRSLGKLSTELETPTCVGDIESLRTRVAGLLEKMDELASAQSAEREKAAEEAIAHREGIVQKIETLAATPLEKIRWKDAGATVDELFAEWKAHQKDGPRLPKATADALWKRFRAARNTLDRGRRAHFQARDKATKEAKTVKRELIEKAQGLAEKGAAGIPAYRELLEQWKKAPRASRSVDDQLWSQFKAAGDVLYQAKTAQAEAEDEANRENGDKKQALVDEYADIVTLTDHREAVERLRLFHDKFRQIGPVPRSRLKAIDAQVKKFDQHVKKLEQEHWDKSNPEKQARSQSFLDQIDEQIVELEHKKANAEENGDKKSVESLTAEIETKVAWKRVLTDA
jgi:hypothetical protein